MRTLCSKWQLERPNYEPLLKMAIGATKVRTFDDDEHIDDGVAKVPATVMVMVLLSFYDDVFDDDDDVGDNDSEQWVGAAYVFVR